MLENTKGFEIAFNLQAKILRLRAWGEWDNGLYQKCEMALRDKIIELSAHAQWKIWYVLVDVTKASAQAEAIRNIVEKHFVMAPEQGVRRIAYLGNCPGPQASPGNRGDSPQYAFFDRQDEAMQWLLN